MGRLSKQEAMEFRKHLERLMDASEESYLFVHESGVCALNIYNADGAAAMATAAIAAIASAGLSGGNPLGDVLSVVRDAADRGLALGRVLLVRESDEHRAWPVVKAETHVPD